MRTAYKALAAALVVALSLALVGAGTDGPAPRVVVPQLTIQEFIQSVTVQIVIEADRYHRVISWYREVDQHGQQGEWRARYGAWEDVEQVRTSGSGTIVFSGITARYPQGVTLILTNAHVVQWLVRRDMLGTRTRPLDVFDDSDLIVRDTPPSVTVRDGARPVEQEYFTLPTEFVGIRHKPDQMYRVYGEIVAYDLPLDVALIAVEGVYGLPYATFRSEAARVGEDVWTSGAPLGIPFSIDRGRINQVGLNLGTSMGITFNNRIKLDLAAAPGSSGSGVYDAVGRIIGVYHAILVSQGQRVHGGGLAIPGMDVREWLMWSGWAFAVIQEAYEGAPYVR